MSHDPDGQFGSSFVPGKWQSIGEWEGRMGVHCWRATQSAAVMQKTALRTLHLIPRLQMANLRLKTMCHALPGIEGSE